MLDSLGFTWSVKDTYWEEMFAALKSFTERFGHCNVPASWKENPGLGRWCANQRARKKRGCLRETVSGGLNRWVSSGFGKKPQANNPKPYPCMHAIQGPQKQWVVVTELAILPFETNQHFRE